MICIKKAGLKKTGFFDADHLFPIHGVLKKFVRTATLILQSVLQFDHK